MLVLQVGVVIIMAAGVVITQLIVHATTCAWTTITITIMCTHIWLLCTMSMSSMIIANLVVTREFTVTHALIASVVNMGGMGTGGMGTVVTTQELF